MKCTDCKLQGLCREMRAKTKNHFRWSFHNLIAHPLSEIVWLLGFKKLSDKIHNKSIPNG
jgi:hypothetical protein